MPAFEPLETTEKPSPRIRLFCFPYAGSGASVFNSWPARLPSGIELRGVPLPGRETRWREKLPTDLPELARLLIEELEWPDEPFAFFGHSMGALIAFEMALALRARLQREPIHLFVSGCRAPHLRDRFGLLCQRSDARLAVELRHLGGTSEEVFKNPELLQLLLPIFRADLALCAGYLCRGIAPLDCPITVFGALDDPRANRRELAAWRRYTASAFSLRWYSGRHFFFQDPASGFIEDLTASLRQEVRWLAQRA
jgi:medium-chain acyl-[acyl-carrier-protein] hydrolase